MESIREDSFKLFIGMSLLAHITIVVVFSVKMVFFPSEDLIIQSAIRVDMVALPDKKIPKAEPAPVKAKVAPKPTPPIEKPKPKPPDLKSKQNKALDRLKAMSALENLKKEVKNEVPKDKEIPEENPNLYKGNVVTKGSDLKGLAKLQFDSYFATLEKHVRQYWNLPQWLADTDYKAQIRVTIDERGYVTSKEVVTSSGNTVFDNMALDAVAKSSPCPVAPEKLQALMASEGIIFKFP